MLKWIYLAAEPTTYDVKGYSVILLNVIQDSDIKQDHCLITRSEWELQGCE